MQKRFALLAALFTLLIVVVVPVSAQTARTFTLTEAEVNNAYVVTNPRNRNLTNVHLDLQVDQVTITATYTTRGRTPVSYNVLATLVPTVTNGRVDWALTVGSVDGTSIPNNLLNQINASIESSWRRYISNTAPLGRVTDITITETDVTWTYSPR